jgi:MFS family permease
MSMMHGWGREVFSLALAIQMLVWGAAQPFVGAVADRFGPVLVLCGGAILYAAGLAWMAYVATPGELHLSAGFIIGIGLAGTSFTVVIGAFGRLLPLRMRSLAFGLGTAAGSFGQFLFSPLAVALNGQVGWQTTLLIFAGIVLIMMPLSLTLAFPKEERAVGAAPGAQQSVSHALREALGHTSYVLLVLGFFACGFQLFFITVHLPAFLADRGLSAAVGGWTIAAIGLFNIIGSIAAGWLGDRMPKRYLLGLIYAARSLAILIYITLPVTPFSSVVFGATMGLLWLSTVPPTQGLVALMFGTRWLTMLAGFVFFSHQVGGFLGVWLGGVLYERTGSYDAIWYVSIALGIMSALINLPIVEKPVERATVPAS